MKILENKGITAPQGFLAGGIHCGLKKNKLDLALIYSEVSCVAAGVFTKNKVKGAPIYITKQHLENNEAQAIIINSGNANTCNGENGLKDAKTMAQIIAKELNLDSRDVLVASTGVIGVPLNIDAIKNNSKKLVEEISVENYTNAATAIMTTDTFKKEIAVEFYIDNKKVTLGAMAKGSGMIEPNMGTMLSFITTDLNISKELLNEALIESTNISYNRVSVDGDTSTNDMVLLLANKTANNEIIETKDENYYKFLEVLNNINITLAKMIAKDGEGASKLIECTVKNAKSNDDANILSKSVINSPLVKTAMFGKDANWGRILCALGYSDIEIDTNKIDVSFKSNELGVVVCQNGKGIEFDEELAKEILSKETVIIDINMNDGVGHAIAWGCDLSYEYVRINGDYRS